MVVPKEEWIKLFIKIFFFFVTNDKKKIQKEPKFAQCTFYSLQLSCFWKFSTAFGKENACTAGRNCSAGINVVELPRLLVWELVKLRSLRPAASLTQQQNNGAQNNPKVISSSWIHKITQGTMSAMSFTNLQPPPIQSNLLFIQGCCFLFGHLRNGLPWISLPKTGMKSPQQGWEKIERAQERAQYLIKVVML